MLKVAATKSIIPKSLYLSGVKIIPDSGRTAGGGFGLVHFGKYRGVEVAVKVLFTNPDRKKIVSYHCSTSHFPPWLSHFNKTAGFS